MSHPDPCAATIAAIADFGAPSAPSTGLLQQVRHRFELLTAGPDPLSVEGAALGYGLPARPIPVPELAAVLRKRFVGCHVFAVDALALQRALPPGLTYDFVISGLPLLLFSPEQRFELLGQILALLRPDGCYQQFTYGGRCPIDRETRRRLNVDSVLLGVAVLNLPPAFVYRLTRAGG